MDSLTWIFVAVTIFAWAVWGITLKLGILAGDPYSMVWWSSLFAIVLVPANWLVMRKVRTPVSTDLHLLLWAALGVVLSGAAVWTYTLALSRHGAGWVTAVTACYPALTMALSVLILREHPGPAQIAGLALTVLGVLLLTR